MSSEASKRSDDVKRIQTILKPSVATMARLFCVPRQTVQGWLNGEIPGEQHADRLDDLARAAMIIAAAYGAQASRAIKITVKDGMCLPDIVAAGGSAQEVARVLAERHHHGEAQRARLDEVLKDRPRRRVPIEDYVPPALDETC